MLFYLQKRVNVGGLEERKNRDRARKRLRIEVKKVIFSLVFFCTCLFLLAPTQFVTTSCFMAQLQLRFECSLLHSLVFLTFMSLVKPFSYSLRVLKINKRIRLLTDFDCDFFSDPSCIHMAVVFQVLIVLALLINQLYRTIFQLY